VTAGYAGTPDAVSAAMPSKPIQLTWDDAMLILCGWIVFVWLILGGG
jgi:hypothetical protein